MLDPKYCKVEVWKGWHKYQCTRKAVRDGYCKQHHPDSVKIREEMAMKKYNERVYNSVYSQLDRANKRIKELEKEVAKLRAKC